MSAGRLRQGAGRVRLDTTQGRGLSGVGLAGVAAWRVASLWRVSASGASWWRLEAIGWPGTGWPGTGWPGTGWPGGTGAVRLAYRLWLVVSMSSFRQIANRHKSFHDNSL